MNFLGFGQSAEIDIVFDGAEKRKTAEVKAEDGKIEKMLLYYDGETVSGKVNDPTDRPTVILDYVKSPNETPARASLHRKGNCNWGPPPTDRPTTIAHLLSSPRIY